MLPPKLPGTIVDRTSAIAGATPKHPRNGASGTSHEYFPSRVDVFAVFRAAFTSYRHVVSGKSAPSIAVLSVPTSAPKPGPNDDTAYVRAGSSLRICTAT